MGGGHGEHHEPFEVPNYKVYNNWQQHKKLGDHARRLEAFGLRDPWIRNVVWLYDGRGPQRQLWGLLKMTVFRGWYTGIAAAAILIAFEESYFYVKYGWTSWNKPHHH